MIKEWWRFIRSVIFIVLTPLGIYGAILVLLSVKGAFIYAIIIGIVTIYMFLSVVSYVSKRNEDQEEECRNLSNREHTLNSEKQRLEIEKKEFEVYKKRKMKD